MTARRASLVCGSCLLLIAGASLADAQPAAKDSAAPPAAAPVQGAPVTTASGPGDSAETDKTGRSKWWPSAPAAQPAKLDPPRETDELGRSKWWPSPPSQDSSDPRPTPPQREEEKAASSPAAPLLPFQKGILFMPYLGLSIPLAESDAYSVGHAFGALIGIHMTPRFSFNAEINVDYMSPGPQATETQTDFALTPLFQSASPRHLCVFGAKLGMFKLSRSVGEGSYDSSDEGYSATGFVWGVTFGGFVPVGPMALGGLARLTVRHLSSNCDTEGIICHENENRGISPALTTFSLSVAALF